MIGVKSKIHKWDATTVQVKAVRLDDIFFSMKRIDLLKIDTEGNDHIVLQGATGILPRIRFILFECHVLQLKEKGGPGTSHFMTQGLLSKHGFATFKIGIGFLIRFDGDMYFPELDKEKGGCMSWQNCFAARPDDPLMKRLKQPLYMLT